MYYVHLCASKFLELRIAFGIKIKSVEDVLQDIDNLCNCQGFVDNT